VPVFDAGSPTAREGAASGEARRRAEPWAKAVRYGFICAFACPVVVGVGVGVGTDLQTGVVAGGVTLAAAVITTLVIGPKAISKMQEVGPPRDSAFATYDSDLRKRLNLCSDGVKLRACEAVAAPVEPTGPAAPTPAPAVSAPAVVAPVSPAAPATVAPATGAASPAR
jgi:hypothetical protein